MTLRDELGHIHDELEERAKEHNGISRKEDQIKWQVSLQNAIGTIIAAVILASAGFLYHWYQSADEVREEILTRLDGITTWQRDHQTFAEYGKRDMDSMNLRIKRVEDVLGEGRRFTHADGQEHDRRLRELESKFAVIAAQLAEIIRRMDRHPGVDQKGIP